MLYDEGRYSDEDYEKNLNKKVYSTRKVRILEGL